MVLTDREIQAALARKDIKITPPPTDVAFSSTSLDLTLSASVAQWRNPTAIGVEHHIVSPAADGYRYSEFAQEFSERKELSRTEGIVVEPGVFLLGWTAEYIELPLHIAARVEGKSSLARLGIGIHVTAPTIHAGFTGTIQLEICNHGTLRVRLLPGMPICQPIFEQTLGTPARGYTGQFYRQTAK